MSIGESLMQLVYTLQAKIYFYMDITLILQL